MPRSLSSIRALSPVGVIIGLVLVAIALVILAAYVGVVTVPGLSFVVAMPVLLAFVVVDGLAIIGLTVAWMF